MAPIPVDQPAAKQPMIMATLMDEKSTIEITEYHQQVDGAHSHHHAHGQCHKSRLRRALPAILSLLALTLFAMVALMDGMDCSMLTGGNHGFSKRQAGTGPSNPNGQDGPFVKNKLYLIVIIVGIFVVIILGVMLSAWCCKGAFQNPLCCPCYLCACCGGLACLECIGCGLCAEGFDQVDV